MSMKSTNIIECLDYLHTPEPQGYIYIYEYTQCIYISEDTMYINISCHHLWEQATCWYLLSVHKKVDEKHENPSS